MLQKADQAMVVIGEEETRSKSMDAALADAVENHGFQARQVLLPCNASPRLDTTRLPLVQFMDAFINSVVRKGRQSGLQVLHATEKVAAKLIITPMRNAGNAGAVLREAHRCAGWYIATEILTGTIVLDE